MKKGITRRQAIGLAGAGVLGLGLSQIGARNDLQIERHTFNLKNWSADGFKIALLTDLHMDSVSKGERAVRAAQLATLEKPDVILIGGDLLSTSKPDGIRACHQALDLILDTKIPIAAVLGNHEYAVANTSKVLADLRDRFRVHGSQLMRNEVLDVQGVTILGVDDGIAGRDKHHVLTASQDKNVVALFHEPDYVDRLPKRISVMLAGHSHGGQVCLPFGISMHTPRGAKRYIKGFYPNANVPLYVSRGVGTVGPSIRTFCPPEVSILTLNSA